jgi:glucose/arabinose dehydrogenase
MAARSRPVRSAVWSGMAALTVALLGTPVRSAEAAPEPEPYLRNLAFPTNLAFAPDGRLFFAEKDTGAIRIVQDDRVLGVPFATVGVAPEAERGLLGIALGPDFARQPWVYVYFSDATDGVNRLARIRADGNTGGPARIVLEGLDSSVGYHNGGDLAFGTDGTLFVSVGEAHDPGRAQDIDDIGGKVLRIEADGTIPADNPFGDQNPVWSYGHRNSFGLCVDPQTGTLWETENGPDVNDEINLIEPGGNYGWPLTTGRGDDEELSQPIAVFPTPIAVTGCAVVDGNLFFGSFDGRLWWLPPGDRAADPTQVARFDAGVTDVAAGPDGVLAIATADAIWRFDPTSIVATGSSPSASEGNSPASPVPGQAEPPDDGSGTGVRRWVAVAAGVALAGGLIARFLAGRRLRRER